MIEGNRTARGPAALVAGAAVLAGLAGTAHAVQQRPLPDTTYGVHVFDDQLQQGLTEAQLAFWTKRVAGTQKMTRSEADRLRAHDPGFLVLHYRLGMGLGYRSTSAGCNPDGGFLQIIDGTWVQEWPGEAALDPTWFDLESGQRRLQCQHGWYLMNLDHPGWRTWWGESVVAQLQHNDADGLFADSLMVPTYLGGWNPATAPFDPTFEEAWARRIERFMRHLKRRFDGEYLLFPNVGWWVTSRDTTDFGIADGVFIEGFGRDVWATFGNEGWRIQIDRLLGIAAAGKAIIGESWHTWGATERMMTVASYLLVKNDRSFIDLEDGQSPTWYAEYEVPIGEPLEIATDVDGLIDPASGMYSRRFTNGVVLVNPTTQARTAVLGEALSLARGTGGGYVGSNGLPPVNTRLEWTSVTAVTLQPGEGAVLVRDTTPYELDVPPLVAGNAVTLSGEGATPGRAQRVFASIAGRGSTPLPALGVTLGLDEARAVLRTHADAAGTLEGTFTVPAWLAGVDLSFQVAELGGTTQVVTRRVFAP